MSLVLLLAWDDTTYATPRIGDVAVPSGYDVNMGVENGLTTGRADVHPHVETGYVPVL